MKIIPIIFAIFILVLPVSAQPIGSPIKDLGKEDISEKFGVPGSNGIRVKAHNGIDFQVKEGTPVYSTDDGVVENVKNSTGHHGLFIRISHGKVYETFYAHLKEAKVKKRARVKKGELIGYSGKSGLTVKPVLHYEVRKNKIQIDPEKFM